MLLGTGVTTGRQANDIQDTTGPSNRNRSGQLPGLGRFRLAAGASRRHDDREGHPLIYFLAIGSAVLYGAADFTGGLTSRRAGALPVVLLSQASGLLIVALLLPVLPHAAPTQPDLIWGAIAGLTGGIGVALLYHALSIATMAVVAPTTAVCAVTIPVVVSVLLGERPVPLAVAGIALGIGSIVLVSRQTAAPAAPHEPTSRSKRSSGIGIALLSGVAIGLFYLSLARTRPEAGLWPLVAARSVSVAFFGVLGWPGSARFGCRAGWRRSPPSAA